jgi:hypothetical protein
MGYRKGTRRFAVRSGSGQSTTIFEVSDFQAMHGYGGSWQHVPSKAELVLRDGNHLNHVAKGVYETVTGDRYESDDPGEDKGSPLISLGFRSHELSALRFWRSACCKQLKR